MEKGSADKMACKACVKKCWDQCPWCRTVLDETLPSVVSRTKAGAAFAECAHRVSINYPNLVPVKYRRIRGCMRSCGFNDCVSIGMCSLMFGGLAYAVRVSTCALECSWACYAQASLAATYAAGTVALIMRPWEDTPMGVLGILHALVGSVFLILCLVGCSQFVAFLLMIVLCPVCSMCSLRLNSHWQ